MINELALGWAKLILAGTGTLVSGLVLYYIKRMVARKDAEEAAHMLAHERYEDNFVRIDDRYPELRLRVRK